MSAITTHVLDTAHGRPAGGVAVRLERCDGDVWTLIGQTVTDADGRAADLSRGSRLEAGSHRLTFAVGDYFGERGVAAFYDKVRIEFLVREPGEHHHVPLLLSPFGYSTYRGS